MENPATSAADQTLAPAVAAAPALANANQQTAPALPSGTKKTGKKSSDHSRAVSERGGTRRSATNLLNITDNLVSNELDIEILEDHLALLNQKQEDLQQQDIKVHSFMNDDDDIEKDVDIAISQYRDKLTVASSKVIRRIRRLNGVTSSTVSVTGSGNGLPSVINTAIGLNSAQSTSGSIASPGTGPSSLIGTGNLSGNSATNYHVSGSGSPAQNNNSGTVTVPDGLDTKLPKLEIQKFNGDITQWTSFWNHYEVAIHNRTVKGGKVTKFNYLASYLEGEAKNAISGLPMTEQSYDEAIQMLTDRFGNKDIIENKLLNNLLGIEPFSKASDIKALRRFHNTCETNVRSLKALGTYKIEDGKTLTTSLIRRIPEETRLLFTREKKQSKLNLDEFVAFLRNEIESREMAVALGASIKSESSERAESQEKGKNKFHQNSRFENKSRGASTSQLSVQVQRQIVYCIFCRSNDHSTAKCTNLNLEARKKFIRESGRCPICFRFNHEASRCTSKYPKCKKCGRKHHIALCEDNEASRVNNPPSQNQRENKEVAKEDHANMATCLAGTGRQVLMQTGKALVRNPKSREESSVRCFFDVGADMSFIEESFSRRLNLPVVGEVDVTMNVFATKETIQTKRRKVRAIIQNFRDPRKSVEIEVAEIPFLCHPITSVKSKYIEDIMKDKGFQLAEEIKDYPEGTAEIGILIGSDHYWKCVTQKTERFSKSLVAVETILGWVINGTAVFNNDPCQATSQNMQIMSMRISIHERGINKAVETLWDLESMGITSSELEVDPTDEAIDNEFIKKIKFENNRYTVSLPWKTGKEVLPDNFRVAVKRLEGLKRTFKQDPVYFAEYKKILEDQLQAGVIEEIKENAAPKEGDYYMPQQGVKRLSSSTTKLRVVNDASSHAKNMPSLNDCLSSGKNLNPDLLMLLLRFRKHKIAIIADIEKAFLQVAIAEDDRDSLRFLWVEEIDGRITEGYRTFRMTRNPFGVTSSPYLLAATIKHHLAKYKGEDQWVAELLNKDLYVDDLTTGASSVKLGKEIYKRSNKIMEKAGMSLKKWNSNSKELRKEWVEENTLQENTRVFIGEKERGELKVLGISWNSENDTFSFELKKLIQLSQDIRLTKRCVLSLLSQIFDPIGILAPFILIAKILFQTLWDKKLKWDEPLPPKDGAEFRAWCEELPSLQKIELPRYYFHEGDERIVSVELHCFCDASQKAYGTVLYVRYVRESGEIGVSLITAKARVAPLPLKKLTIPKLELMGCLLGAKIVEKVKDIFEDDKIEIFMWTDSMIALYWIKGSPKTWKPFVSNRIVDIQTRSDPQLWSHCPGEENPADLPTRGLNGNKLVESKLWWYGPHWLKKTKEHWPGEIAPDIDSGLIEEEKRKTILTVSCKEKLGLTVLMKLENFSCLNKALRITAWLLRIVMRFKKEKTPSIEEPISANELSNAEILWLRAVQEEEFVNEINDLKEGKSVRKTSKILSLRPILNNEGLLCVGGRLNESEFGYAKMHPIILDKKQRLANLLVKRCHNSVLHTGVQSTVTQLRERYWVVSARQLTRQIIRSCTICKELAAIAGDEITAPLPKERIREATPFEVIGVDFAGPLFVRPTLGSDQLEKAYICLMTCAVTRALHLELVPSLTTRDFIMAFRNMIGRRGIPRVIYSDNARTFIRANEDLKQIWKCLDSNGLKEFFGEKGITWHFIAERAAWWGGFYERMVRSVKTALKKVIGRASLHYREMETVLIETEAMINSRPITYVYNDTNEPSPLTPAHFLIGKRLLSLPDQNIKTMSDKSTNKELTRRLEYRQNLQTRLWKRWNNEYLAELRSAHHCAIAKRERSQIKEGDVVLIHEDKKPKQSWKLGLVTQEIIGRDGKVRACLVRTPNGILRRPVQLLYNLEVSERFQD